MTTVTLDVLVCAHNEAAYIPRLFESLHGQTAGVGAFRVILVDNASTDDTPRIVEQHRGQLDVTYVYEARTGLNAARNAGYRRARADYVAHLDGDTAVDKCWVETALAVIDRERPDLCGGPYFPYFLGSRPAWFLDRYNSKTLGDQPHLMGANEYLSGTTMIWRRALVEQLGGFDGAIGTVGRVWIPGDETELIRRARREAPGFRAYYHPGIIVYHLTRPEALSMEYWARRHYRSGRVHRAIFADADQPYLWPLLRLAGHCAIDAWRVLYGLVAARWLRNRAQFPMYENYVFERMLPGFATLGELCDRLSALETVLRRVRRLQPILGT